MYITFIIRACGLFNPVLFSSGGCFIYLLEAFQQRRIDCLAKNCTKKSLLLVIVFISVKEDVIFRCFGTVDNL